MRVLCVCVCVYAGNSIVLFVYFSEELKVSQRTLSTIQSHDFFYIQLQNYRLSL